LKTTLTRTPDPIRPTRRGLLQLQGSLGFSVIKDLYRSNHFADGDLAFIPRFHFTFLKRISANATLVGYEVNPSEKVVTLLFAVVKNSVYSWLSTRRDYDPNEPTYQRRGLSRSLVGRPL